MVKLKTQHMLKHCRYSVGVQATVSNLPTPAYQISRVSGVDACSVCVCVCACGVAQLGSKF